MKRHAYVATVVALSLIAVTPALAAGQARTHLGGKPSEMIHLQSYHESSGISFPARVLV